MQIGPYQLQNKVLLAPMAGITDGPFRSLCRRFGAALAFSEMVSANPSLRYTAKSVKRRDYQHESGLRAVQLVGTAPRDLAQAACFNVDQGAELVDINMGCPAKKVCNVRAGSALLQDEALVGRILDAVVAAVTVPVTLKIRTGWDPAHRNGVAIARLAEAAGIQALTVHGRTRACRFTGPVEYDTIAAIKGAVGIPVIANGDIDSPAKARRVLEATGADAVMIGRAAQGRPWIFGQIARYLETGRVGAAPTLAAIRQVVLAHLDALHDFYGEAMGVRIARKHLAWYTTDLAGSLAFRKRVNSEESARAQRRLTNAYLSGLVRGEAMAA
ncbi:MAG: tRNA dihydrouridine synthase DusB [Gammaproteobacteria bacterium]|nr:tRNA dihydrouridine synthase DusB [Gammaproteobacteria bacterium]